jgi:hypothetical protein
MRNAQRTSSRWTVCSIAGVNRTLVGTASVWSVTAFGDINEDHRGGRAGIQPPQVGQQIEDGADGEP